MREIACEWIRDRLPDYAGGREAAETARRIEAHLTACVECRGELDLLRALQTAMVTTPAGLEERVRVALQSKQRTHSWSTRPLALAATLAFALITGALLIRGSPGQEGDNNGLAGLPADGSILGEPLLPGASGLEVLSEDELLKLLEEMDS